MTATHRRLVGVGVGPGDPELVTVKAARLLAAADAILVPATERSEGAAGRAEQVVLAACPEAAGVDIEEVVATLQARPGVQHVVVTGRGCPPALLDAADLVTEMTKVRHPFDRGQKGQRGIEW